MGKYDMSLLETPGKIFNNVYGWNSYLEGL